MSHYGYGQQWDPYVPVGQRKSMATKEAKKSLKKGQTLAPIRIKKRTIAETFWGKGWCENLEHYSDYSNRLPRGRTYARNGSIVDLQIKTGIVQATVAGSSPYHIHIEIEKLGAKRWKQLRRDCSESIHSLIDLMRGRLPDEALHRLTDAKTGMFPSPREIDMTCDCPDGASLCKHLAAVLYGVGHRLDSEPDLLFLLRGVKQQDLVTEALSNQNVDTALGSKQDSSIEQSDLESIFGIDIAASKAKPRPRKKAKKRVPTKKSPVKAAKKKAGRKKAVKKKAVNKKTVKKKVVKKKAVKKKVAKKKSVKKKAVKKKSPQKKTSKQSLTKKASGNKSPKKMRLLGDRHLPRRG